MTVRHGKSDTGLMRLTFVEFDADTGRLSSFLKAN